MPELAFTPLDDINKIHAELRAGFYSGKLKLIAYRKYQLLQLAYLIKDNITSFDKALALDLGRPLFESRFIEINACLTDIKKAYDNVEKWAKPEKPALNLQFAPMRPVIFKEPKGVVLVIGPFNFPVVLTLSRLASALAAGNSVVIKPSESCPTTANLIAELVPKYLDSSVARVVNGAIPEMTRLLELQWDHILFTGSARVGRIVAAAAAKHLTPVSLELGGKSPAIIDPGCDLESAAKRILWGKMINAGQVCLSPDYVLVPRAFQDQFIAALQKALESFYPEGRKSSDAGTFSRIVTPQAFKRLKDLLDTTQGKIVVGGETNEETKYMAPTFVRDVTGDDSLMRDEIFGPILPIVPVEDLDEAVRFVNARDHPLVLYVFTKDAKVKAKVFENTQSGAAVANDTIIHSAVDGLPFGGIGASGYGMSTGKFGFDMFTHFRSSIDCPSWIDKILGFRFPPYTGKSLKGSKTSEPNFPARALGPPSANDGTIKWWHNWFIAALTLTIAGTGVIAKRAEIRKTILSTL